MTIPLPDRYTLWARFIPAAIAGAPAIALALAIVSWDSLNPSQAVAALALGVVLVAFSDMARRLGKRIEPLLEQRQGGKPSTVFLRHRDSFFDAQTKSRFLGFIAKQLGETPPTASDEAADPSAADAFYERACAWLRARTRDTKRFHILFEENVTYGFRRNLLGLKWVALSANLAVVIIIAAVMYWLLPHDDHHYMVRHLVLVLLVALVHAVYVLATITERGAIEAARQYARQLILSTEDLISPQPTKPTAKPTRRRTTHHRSK